MVVVNRVFLCTCGFLCVLVGRGLGKRASASLNGHHVPMCLNWRGVLSSGESFWGWCLSRASKYRHVLVPHLKPPMRRWWVTDSQQSVRCDICQQMRKWFAAFNSKPLFACQNRGAFFHKPAQLSTSSDFLGQWIYLFIYLGLVLRSSHLFIFGTTYLIYLPLIYSTLTLMQFIHTTNTPFLWWWVFLKYIYIKNKSSENVMWGDSLKIRLECLNK